MLSAKKVAAFDPGAITMGTASRSPTIPTGVGSIRPASAKLISVSSVAPERSFQTAKR